MDSRTASRRGNHDGSLFQRADGYWVASVRLGGKRIVRYAKSRKDASRRLQELLQQQHVGNLTAPSKLTLQEWTEHWLSERELRPSALFTYRQVLSPLLKDLGG